MLNEKTVANELYKFSVNYSIELNPDYVKFLLEDLQELRFTDDDFISAIKQIKRTTITTFNKMPNLAMFIEARPVKHVEPTYFRAIENKEKLTDEQRDVMSNKLKELLNKLKAQ